MLLKPSIVAACFGVVRTLILVVGGFAFLGGANLATAADRSETYKFVDPCVTDENVILICTFTRAGDKWTISADWYWAARGNKHRGHKDGERVFGFKGAHVKYNAAEMELEFDQVLDKNPFKWANTHWKGQFVEGGKYFEAVLTWPKKGKLKVRLIKP
jgi:hypothetical protein